MKKTMINKNTRAYDRMIDARWDLVMSIVHGVVAVVGTVGLAIYYYGRLTGNL